MKHFINYLCLPFVFTVLYGITKSGALMAKSNPATMTLMPFWIRMLQKDIDGLAERVKSSGSGIKSDLDAYIIDGSRHDPMIL